MIDFREYSFLDNPRLPDDVKNSRVRSLSLVSFSSFLDQVYMHYAHMRERQINLCLPKVGTPRPDGRSEAFRVVQTLTWSCRALRLERSCKSGWHATPDLMQAILLATSFCMAKLRHNYPSIVPPCFPVAICWRKLLHGSKHKLDE